VIHLHQSSRDSDFPSQLELPAALLKQVLTRHGLRLGERILVAGCGRGELVAFLDGLAYCVDAVDDCSDGIENARKRFPRFQFDHARLDESPPTIQDEFDLILVQDLCVYRDNLMDLKTRSATANLLGCLKPGGQLVFIRKHSSSLDDRAEHKPECWNRHLVCFPGRLGTRDHRYRTVALQIPSERLPRASWQDFARRGLTPGHDSCCATGLTESGTQQHAA
jgi:SAM-dependent methyltransferase